VPTRQKVRFGPFELDPASGELFKLGHKLNLRGQPVEVLSILLERPGEVVKREELCKRLWPQDTFVDFEHSLNTAIKRLRQALDDDVEMPRYIETLPKKGYRFVGLVESFANGADAIAATTKTVSGPPAASPPTPPSILLQTETEKPKSRRWVWAVAVLAVLAVAAGVASWLLRPRVPVISAIRQLTHTGHQKSGYVVTDGTRIYFNEKNAGKSHVAEVSTAGGEVSYLDTQLDNSTVVDISPNGSELLAITRPVPTSFWIVPLPAGSPRRIPGEFSWAGFLPGSSQIVYLQPSNFLHLFASDVDGGNAHPLLQLPRDPVTLYFAISPDERLIRYGTADGKVWESRIDGTQKQLLSPAFGEPTRRLNWTAGNKLFLLASRKEEVFNLWAISESGWLRGRHPQPVQLTFGPISFPYATASKDGKHIYAVGRTQRGELSIYDTRAATFRKYLNGISAGSTDFSRDGQWIAYVTEPQGNLWRSRLDGSERRQLTFSPMGPILVPKWSPDGRFLAFIEWGDQRKIYLLNADGGAPMLLLSGDFQPADPGWSPDGKFLVYGGEALNQMSGGNPKEVTTEIRILDLSTRKSKTVPGSQGMFSPRWSPDGRYLAALSDDQKRLYLYSFESQHWQQLPLPKLSEPAWVSCPYWSHDSRYLYFRSGEVYKLSIPGGQPEIVAGTAGVDTGYPAMQSSGWFGLTPDDHILMMLDRSLDEVYALDVEYR
jgi:DNA-binding winged helix-turn-helix (wHTH) protein/Tol biopolymer transport system component